MGRLPALGGLAVFALLTGNAFGVAAVSEIHTSSAASSSGRSLGCAQLLPDGRVMLIGGSDSSGIASSTELYDPARDAWDGGPSMATERRLFGCTLLRDGRILVSGGTTNSGATDRMELFDPSKGTWSDAGTMTVPRDDLTSTLLADGRVLLAGGNGERSLELFDPATGSTSQLPMTTDHVAGAAARLRDGNVLLLGNGAAILFSPDAGTLLPLATPANASDFNHTGTLLPGGLVLQTGGTFTASLRTYAIYTEPAGAIDGGTFSEAREDHSATLLPSGNVLLSGGSDSDGGAGSKTIVRSLELYSPQLGFADAGAMRSERENHTTTLLPSGEVLVAGGRNQSGAAVSLNDLVYELRPYIAQAPPVPGPTNDFRALLLPNGDPFILGGNFGPAVLQTSARFDAATGQWIDEGLMRQPRETPAAAVLLDGRVLVAGGITDAGYTNSAELHVPGTTTWSPAPPMSVARRRLSAIVLRSGEVLVPGGINTAPVAITELYEPEANQWVQVQDLSQARFDFALAQLEDGTVLAAGGTGATASERTCDRFDPVTRTWLPAAQLNVARSLPASALLPNGKVLVAGGTSNTGTALPSAELYDPATNSWTLTPPMKFARISPAAALLSSGRVVVVGGVNEIELYDFRSNSWLTLPSAFPQARLGLALLPLLDGRLFAFAGRVGTTGVDYADYVEVDGRSLSPRAPTLNPLVDVLPGATFTISGGGFLGDSEASSGTTMASPTDHPLLEVRDLAHGDYRYALTRSWSDTSAVVTLPPSLGTGFYAARVVVNGIPSRAQPLHIGAALPADGGVDAGVVEDAGADAGEPELDGGTSSASPLHLAVGCDCDQTGGASLLALIFAAALRRRATSATSRSG